MTSRCRRWRSRRLVGRSPTATASSTRSGEPEDQIIADPYLINNTSKDPQKLANRLAPLLQMTPAATLAALTKPHSGYIKLATVSPQVSNRIMAMNINGISPPVPVQRRAYPRGTELAQVLGWVGSGGGVDGLEYEFNKQLLRGCR